MVKLMLVVEFILVSSSSHFLNFDMNIFLYSRGKSFYLTQSKVSLMFVARFN